jgi:hypothetical protein
MSSRGGVRGLARTLSVAAVVLSGTVCTVDNGGLTTLSGQAGGGGAAGHAGAGGKAGGSGGSSSGTGGSATGGAAGSGTGGVGATGGSGGRGGTTGTGGRAGSGGQAGTGGAAGSGGSSTGGASSVGGQGGSAGTGGVAGGAGGTAGAGGGGGAGGTAGAGGGGGVAGGNGGGGAGGAAGAGGRPDCSSYPAGSSMMLPPDMKLHCYWAHGNPVDWNSAETICENEGGTLVSILSSMENMLVLHLATQANLFTMGVPVAIGATDGKASNDQSGPGNYEWVTGETWNYTNWQKGEPSGNCTGCGGIGFGCTCDHWLTLASDGTWYDRSESTARPFVCEAIAR